MTQALNKPRLRWGCRRGMWELDLLLLNFFDQCFDSLSLEQQQCFADLLESQDPDLFAWLMNYEPAPEEYQAMVQRIQANNAANA